MPSATQVTPGASISTLVAQVFSGVWFRSGEDRTDNHPEIVEIELFRHLASHTGEVALWTFRGFVGQEALDDEYSVPLPTRIDLAGDYCWRVRLRDNFGSWTAWTSKAVFTFSSTAPVLSSAIPSGETFETLQHVFFGATYSDANGDRPARLWIVLYPTGAASTVLWRTNGQYIGRRERVGTWYNGRALAADDYTWEMYATDQRGTQSNTLTGTFTLTKGYEPDPGASPNLTGYASP